MNLAESTVSAITSLTNAVSNMKDFGTSRSLTDVAQVARVEPLTLIDTDCVNYEYTPDITQSLLNIFAGYYLQAVNVLGSTINNVSVAKKLAPLNPHRSIFEEDRYKLASESYKYALPTSHRKSVSLENSEQFGAMNVADKDTGSQLKENVNLSIGRMFNITIQDNNNKVTVPISIRLLVNSITPKQMSEIFISKGGVDHNLKERWHLMKAGRLSFFKDLILCNDLIDKQRRHLIKDKNDAMNQMVKNDNLNKIKGLISQNPSLANASNLIVISTDTAATIESELGFKLKDFTNRQKLFSTTNVMIMVVVDKAWDQVTFYHRGLNESTQLSAKSLKSSNKGDNNVMDILTAYLRGSAPSI